MAKGATTVSFTWASIAHCAVRRSGRARIPTLGPTAGLSTKEEWGYRISYWRTRANCANTVRICVKILCGLRFAHPRANLREYRASTIRANTIYVQPSHQFLESVFFDFCRAPYTARIRLSPPRGSPHRSRPTRSASSDSLRTVVVNGISHASYIPLASADELVGREIRCSCSRCRIPHRWALTSGSRL